MTMPTVQFKESVYYEGRQYSAGDVYELSAETVKALGDSVQPTKGHVTDRNADADNDADARTERDVPHEADDVQKTPDAEKDEDAKAKKAKALAAAPKDKMVSGAPTNK
jgi:hypothetical protein